MLRNFLGEDCLLARFKASSKKQVLQSLAAEMAVKTGLNQRDIFNALLERERLGSTAVGAGVAIPHCRIKGISEVKAVFARLDTPVDFDAPDGEAVDLVFVLLAPINGNADHLQALSKIARLMRRPELRHKLRTCTCAEEIGETIQPALRPAA